MKKFLEFLKENLDLRNIDNVEAIICSSASACIIVFWGILFQNRLIFLCLLLFLVFLFII